MASNDTGRVDSLKTSAFSWDIDNIRLINKNVGEELSSPEFSVNGTRWQIKIYPNGCSQGHKGYVSVAVQSPRQEDSKEFILVVSFVNYYNKLLFSCMECVTFSAEHNSWQLDRLVEYEEFMRKLNHVAPDNKIKIKCELLHNASTNPSVCTPMNFENFFNSEALSDVKFSVGDKEVYAHKVILSVKSEVYAAMFKLPMRENVDNVVRVEAIEYEVLFEMLRFMYTGRVRNMKSHVKELLIAADKYAIHDLKFICGECLCAGLSIDNVVEYLELADAYNVKALRSNAIDFILSNSKTLVDIPSFKSLVELPGDLIFEIFRRLVIGESRTDETAGNSKGTGRLAYNFSFNTPPPPISNSSINEIQLNKDYVLPQIFIPPKC